MPNKIVIIFALCLLFAACAGGPKTKPAPTKKEPDEQAAGATESPGFTALQNAQLREAVGKLNEGESKIARKSLLQLEKTAPANSLVISNLAAIALHEGEFETAASYAQQALHLDQANAQAHNIIGLVAVENGAISEAEDAYIKALTLDKNFANAHFNLALVYDIYYQDLKNAIRHYQAYLTLIDFQDERTLEWVQELERSLENQ